MFTSTDITGQRFGKLVACWPVGRRWSHVVWLCVCDCGSLCRPDRHSLNSGKVSNCGRWCRKKARDAHSKSRTYATWECMIQRCTNPNTKDFKDYGGRGIVVCDRWMIFRNFLADMGERPEGKTLDRIDNDGNYGIGNCKWSTPSEQQRNKRCFTRKEKH